MRDDAGMRPRVAALVSMLRETLAGTVPDDALDAVVDTLRINVYRWLSESPRACVRAPLPPSTVVVLREVRDAARASRTGSTPSQVYSYYLFSLRRAGWTLEALSAAAGVSRETIRHRVKMAGQVDLGGLPVPRPPLLDLPGPAPAPRPHAVLTEEQIRELSRIQVDARRCRGVHAADHPYRVASERLAKLLHAHHESGVRYVILAAVLGVSENTVRARLQKHGYKRLSPSQRGYQGVRGEITECDALRVHQ